MIIPYPKYTYCGALGVDNFVVDPNGYLYSCFEMCNKPEHSIGNVSQQMISINSNYIKWLASELPQKCDECINIPICQGGCPLERVMYNEESKCEYSVFSMKERLKLLYDIHLKDENFLDELCK